MSGPRYPGELPGGDDGWPAGPPQRAWEQPTADPAHDDPITAPAPPSNDQGRGDHLPPPAGWWIRVGATLLDGILTAFVFAVPSAIGLYVALRDATLDLEAEQLTGADPIGLVIIGIAGLASLGFDAWNRGVRVGRRGHSLGKQAVGVTVIAADGTPLGPLEGFMRWLLAVFLQMTFIGTLIDLLWPLWDDRKQTVHDKALNAYPVRAA